MKWEKHRREWGRVIVGMVLQEQQGPTLVLLGSGSQVRGIHVSVQLPGIGYNDVVLAGCAGVTTTWIPEEVFGRCAATLLLDRMGSGFGRDPTRPRFMRELIDQRKTLRRGQSAGPSDEQSESRLPLAPAREVKAEFGSKTIPLASETLLSRSCRRCTGPLLK